MTATDSIGISRRGLLAGDALAGGSPCRRVPPRKRPVPQLSSRQDSGPPRSTRQTGPTRAQPAGDDPRQRHAMVRTFGSAGHGWTSNGIGTIILGNMSDYALGSPCVSVITSAGENVWGQRSEIFTTIPAFDLTSKAIKV